MNTPIYTGGFTNQPSKSYKSYLETSVRCFIKACLSDSSENRYGIPKGVFSNYQDLIDFVYSHEPAKEVKLTISSVSKLKNRNTISRAVPRTSENESFIKYVLSNFKSFESDRFFREFSTEVQRSRRKTKV